MEHPDFLNRRFAVKITPAIVLLNSLSDMLKIATSAVLFVRGAHQFQILAYVPYTASCATLDMGSDLISAPSNADGYSLHFHLHTWYDLLKDSIMRDPFTYMFILKCPGSLDLCCLYGSTQKLNKLGLAYFVSLKHINTDNHPCTVKVSIRPAHFRDFIEGFAAKHEHTVFEVELHITSLSISLIVPGYYQQHARQFKIEGLSDEAYHIYRVRWYWPLFKMLCSASICSDVVVISVFRNSLGKNLYGFRFLRISQAISFTYMEKEFEPL